MATGALDTRLLRAFVTVASCGSVSRAAATLGYSQPAITQQIRELERHVGTDLFVRGATPLRLSEAGLQRLAVAEVILLMGHRMVGGDVGAAGSARPEVRGAR